MWLTQRPDCFTPKYPLLPSRVEPITLPSPSEYLFSLKYSTTAERIFISLVLVNCLCRSFSIVVNVEQKSGASLMQSWAFYHFRFPPNSRVTRWMHIRVKNIANVFLSTHTLLYWVLLHVTSYKLCCVYQCDIYIYITVIYIYIYIYYYCKCVILYNVLNNSVFYTPRRFPCNHRNMYEG